MKTWPTTNGWAYTSPSTVSVNTLPNCWTLTLLVVNAVSLSFQPDLVLSLCCVRTDTDWGFVVLGAVGFSLHVASNTRTSGSGSLRLTMMDAMRKGASELTLDPDSEQVRVKEVGQGRPTLLVSAANRASERRSSNSGQALR